MVSREPSVRRDDELEPWRSRNLPRKGVAVVAFRNCQTSCICQDQGRERSPSLSCSELAGSGQDESAKQPWTGGNPETESDQL